MMSLREALRIVMDMAGAMAEGLPEDVQRARATCIVYDYMLELEKYEEAYSDD